MLLVVFDEFMILLNWLKKYIQYSWFKGCG